MTAPRHMAPPGYVVLCGDFTPHIEGGTFDTPAAAQEWIDHDLRCPGRRHRYVREGVLAEVGL